METKFKIGDTIFDPDWKCTCTVLDIVFEKKQYKGNWICFSTVEVCNSYILQASNNRYITYLDFKSAERYRLVARPNRFISTLVSNSCPRCGSPLIEKKSIGLGEMIKKCSDGKCGWC